MRLQCWIILAITWLFFPVAAAAAATEENPRFALVIGNGSYQHLPSLVNPTIDAQKVAKALQDIGFSVETAIDDDAANLTQKIAAFHSRLQVTQSGGIGLFYYAGHGFEKDGENQIIPIDGDLIGAASSRNVSLSSVVIPAPEGVTPIYIFDACRNLLDRSKSRGFQRFDPPPNTFIGFSTSFGAFATDGVPGFGSQFAVKFGAAIAEPGASPAGVFSAIQNVFKTGGLAQAPVYISNLRQEVFLNKKIASDADKLGYVARIAYEQGLRKDSINLAKRAAKRGSLGAKLLLVQIYLTDLKDRKSYEHWLKRAAADGDDDSAAQYAAQFVWPKNRKVAERTLESLFTKGNAKALLILPYMRSSSGCNEPDDSSSDRCADAYFDLYESSVEHGHLFGLVELASVWKDFGSREKPIFYQRLLYNYIPHPGLAVRLANSLSTFGERHRHPEHDAEALDLYAEAASRGDIEARLRVTLLAALGIGTTSQPANRLPYLADLLRTPDLPKIDGIDNIKGLLEAIASGHAVEPNLYPNGRFKFYDRCGPDVAPKNLSERTRCKDAALPKLDLGGLKPQSPAARQAPWSP